MGNKNSTKKQVQVEPPFSGTDEGITTDEALVEEQLAELEQLPECPLKPEARFQKRKSHYIQTFMTLRKW